MIVTDCVLGDLQHPFSDARSIQCAPRPGSDGCDCPRACVHEAEASTRATDVAGYGVHEAARIGSLAEGGQILASLNTRKAVAARYPVSPPRTVTLPGVSQPVNVVTIDCT